MNIWTTTLSTAATMHDALVMEPTMRRSLWSDTFNELLDDQDCAGFITGFNETGYKALLEEMKNPSLTLTAKKWIETTNAVGLQSKMGKNGGTYAHPEIACAFCAWLRPQFQYSLVQSFLTEHRNWRPTE